MGTVLKERNFCHTARKYLQEYNNSTSIHGLHYLTEERSLTEKIVWSIILLISLSGCVYMISGIARKYQITPVVVNIASEDTPLYEIPFPAITICPEAKFSSNVFNYTDFYFKLSALDKDATENLAELVFIL
ncbi:hypothetical protein Zmor_024795 [Zophobas morio]|uniref:Uncharacterized protein n=1 Tax=Zophobas morio TaxID=2755281 RepID=A0AA38M8F5_9CUCU|nr:hypothetical protein Zmor_024795 [Zophobas morio]